MSTETATPTQLERLTMELLGLPTATFGGTIDKKPGK
jgi:hypothetical protein